MIQKEIIVDQVNAFVMYKYLQEYNRFEKIIKDIFSIQWSDMNDESKKRLIYYVGFISNSEKYIDYDTYSLTSRTYKYNENKVSNRLSINQIIRFEKKEKNIGRFNFKVNSFLCKSSQIQYQLDSYDCFLKFINMRNKLAHNVLDLSFKTSDVVEILHDNILQSCNIDWFAYIEFERLTEFSRCILSNYLYLVKIIGILEEGVN